MKSLVKALLYALILLAIGAGGAMLMQTHAAAQGEADPSRTTEIVVSVNEYQWWLTRWNTNGIACVVGIDQSGLPSNLDVLADCGTQLYNEWMASAPCPEAASGNTSACPGLYLFLAGQQTVEKTVEIDLPMPSIWLELTGCSPTPALSYCDEIPNLVFSAIEPLPNEEILAIHVFMDDRIIDCSGDRCEIPLTPTAFEGDEIEFWADSTYGDESEHFTARLRVVDAGVTSGPETGEWFVDIISSQWRGSSVSSCAAMWEAFPPLGGLPQWLTTPEDHTGLASDVPFVFLAGELIRSGVVDASACGDRGLLGNGAASPCGVEAARTVINDWQDQFDLAIFQSAVAAEIPAQLLKNLFAQESQFWPGQSTVSEYGLGQLTEQGADTTLLWNVDFYNQFCPLMLHEETCSKGYAFIGLENQALLRGALATQSGADCLNCTAGVDLAHAQTTIDLFTETVQANCSQVAFLVSDITGEMPGEVSTYEDLWRFTLASYNAGPYCLAKAMNQAWSQYRTMNWTMVSSRLTTGCAGAIEYVDRITRDRLPADADFLPSPTPTQAPFATPVPVGTPQPSPTPAGYPPPQQPTATQPGYPAPEPTNTPAYP